MPSSSIPTEWIEILFGKRDFTDGIGLYMTPIIGSALIPRKGFKLSTLMLGDKLGGLKFELSGLEFLLCMTDPKLVFNPKHPGYADILYRPKGMVTDGRPTRIKIFWE